MLRFSDLKKRDDGVAIIMVIGVGMVLTVLVTALVATALSGYVKAKNEEDWNSAMAAAYAAVDEYESRISNDNTYVQYRNPASPFSAGGRGDLPLETNPAFGLGVSGTWANVSGSAGKASFRYEVDNSQYSNTGAIRLRATGRVGTATRSIVVSLKQQGFIDFLYYTTFEIQDPVLTGKSAATCDKYAWAGRPSSCGTIQFASRDVINGPLHSNDTMVICGATFNGKTTSSSTASPNFSKPSGCSNPTFAINTSNKPDYALPIDMPATNLQMKREVRTDLPDDVARPGCLYTGPTSITFNSDGTMTVFSPWTKKTQVAGDPSTSGTTPAMCGAVGTNNGQLGKSPGATFTVPANNLIYVQSVPSSSSSDPNYWATNARPSSYGSNTCTNGNGIGYPTTNESVASVATSYGCRNGDVFVKGTVNGKVTIASGNYIYVVDNIKYSDAQSDVLGLVGENAVWVWNPVKSNGTNLLTDSSRRIDAAVLSVQHTFQVQNYDQGDYRGTLTINGAIAQKYRGPVGTGGSSGHASTGYDKDYNYDQRLRYVAPPKFLSPVSTSYGISVLVEVAAAFSATGASR